MGRVWGLPVLGKLLAGGAVAASLPLAEMQTVLHL